MATQKLNRQDEAAEARRRRLSALVKEEPSRIDKRPEDTVMVWPHLVVIEFLCVAALVMVLLIMSLFINAPLEEHANPDITPNPSKAPWYFLNLQELLLHMHPSLAGVFIPALLILALMSIPYLDTKVWPVGLWFSSAKGRWLALVSAVYTAIWVLALIIFDELVGVRPLLTRVGAPPVVVEIVVPLLVMFVLMTLLFLIIQRWSPTQHEVVIAFFTGFIITYLVLTVVGTVFRGSGMHLYYPWEMPPRH